MGAVAKFGWRLACIVALTMIAPRPALAGTAALASADPPPGFDQLANSRVVFVDVYYGGRKVTETSAVTRPGTLRFRSPQEILSQLPDVIDTPQLAAELGGELPTNSDSACSRSNVGECGQISPQVLGIIYDEDRFRVDVFVNPRFLKVAHVNAEGYLPIPSGSLSLTNVLGLNASGTFGGSSQYNFQNRTIAGLRNARIRANTSISSDLGLIADDIVAEVDRKDLRYSAGMFWAPGSDFIGQRRIIGAGFGTQFDTSADQVQLQGTPLIVFLAQPARVEILVDGRLVSSRSYAAGNIGLDTSELSEGSYQVLLRIRQANGVVREERRFFVKNSQVPPSGHRVVFAYAGVLANTRRNQPISPSNTLYYQAGTAWRLSNGFALDVGLLGTQHKAIVQTGAWFIRGPVRARAAALYSTAGDAGVVLQASSAGHGPLNVTFDLRRMWSHDGKPLIPLASHGNSFDGPAPIAAQLSFGSYTQATGSVGLQLGAAYLSVVGSYRKDRNLPPDYSVGPSLNWPVVTRNHIQVVFEASASRTRTSTAAFGGFRVHFNSGPLSMLSTVGRGYQSDAGTQRNAVTRAVSTVTAQYSYENDANRVNVGAGFDRNIASSLVHATGTFDSRLGNLRADLLHDLEGSGGTQYDIGLQSGLVIGPGGPALAARDLQQSALMVSLDGDARDASFNVLVNDAPRGRVRTGQRLVVFVAPYRTYSVRVVPVAAASVDFDTAAREITLYPGNVQSLRWRTQTYLTVFGQAVSKAGAAIPDALVQSGKSIAQTDGKGYFQLDLRDGDPVTIVKVDGSSCRVDLGKVAVRAEFTPVGKVLCQ